MTEWSSQQSYVCNLSHQRTRPPCLCMCDCDSYARECLPASLSGLYACFSLGDFDSSCSTTIEKTSLPVYNQMSDNTTTVVGGTYPENIDEVPLLQIIKIENPLYRSHVLHHPPNTTVTNDDTRNTHNTRRQLPVSIATTRSTSPHKRTRHNQFPRTSIYSYTQLFSTKGGNSTVATLSSYYYFFCSLLNVIITRT